MRCILCDTVFPDRSQQEILEDDAIEYLCNHCYEIDFEVDNLAPIKNSFRDEVQDTVDYFISNRLRNSKFILDEDSN